MNIYLAVICKSFSVNRDDNTFSVFEIIEDLQPSSFPALFPPLNAVFFSEKESSEPNIIPITIETKFNNTLIKTQQIGLEFKGTNKNRLIIQVAQTIIDRAGKVSITIYYNERRDSKEVTISITQPIAIPVAKDLA